MFVSEVKSVTPAFCINSLLSFTIDHSSSYTITLTLSEAAPLRCCRGPKNLPFQLRLYTNHYKAEYSGIKGKCGLHRVGHHLEKKCRNF